jgi:hypothetical protein
VCATIASEANKLGTGINALGRFGGDIEKLVPYVTGSQQATVDRTVGDILRFLKAGSTGSVSQADVRAVAADSKQIGEICASHSSP